MRILQINTTVNSGSTGRIAEDIGKVLMADGHESYIAAAYTNQPSQSEVIRIGNGFDRKWHVLKTRLFDRHGFGSITATRNFVSSIKTINPDIIHLHNIHGYFLNVAILFNLLKEIQKPVVWTFHDCWPFTGHCSYFDFVNCDKWKTKCFKCPNKHAYPASWFIDNSMQNFNHKKELFSTLSNLQIVTPSNWLSQLVKESFLSNIPVQVINNGIDLDAFVPEHETELLENYKIGNHKIIFGVASVWDRRKGLLDFIKLNKLLSDEYVIVLLGLNAKQLKKLPEDIIGIARTESIRELAVLYSASAVFINPTYVDNFPTTNIEALACGIPVITYNTGGSPEAIDTKTGIVVEKGDIKGLWKAVKEITSKGKKYYTKGCRARAEKMFDKEDRYLDYLNLYKKLLR